jgi:hypothetical protein
MGEYTMNISKWKTRQALFNKTYKGVLAQGKASARNGTCVYLSEDGSRCAVGHLINKSLIRDSFNTFAIGNALRDNSKEGTMLRTALKKSHVDLVGDFSLLHALQRAHDDSALGNSKTRGSHVFLRKFLVAMRRVAKEFDLKVPSLNKES